MSYERPGRVLDLIADEQITHNVPHYQGGAAGVPIKQDNPKTLDSLASRTQIAQGVKYVLRVKGIWEGDNTGLTALNPGDPVYIHKTTDALSGVASAGNNVPFGRVQSQGGTTGSPNTATAFGTAPGKIRINMDMRDTIPVP